MSSPNTTPNSFEEAVDVLDLGFAVFSLRNQPAELAERLTERIKLAAKHLGKAADMQHSKALEAVAHAARFPSWHHLSAHLARAENAATGSLPAHWSDALSGALILLLQVQPDIALPEAQAEALQRFAQALAMLTDAPLQVVLDGVFAPLCAGKSWHDVRTRGPLQSKHALYLFTSGPDAGADTGDGDVVGGYFDESPACSKLIAELDENWQGYDKFYKPQKKKARNWVEAALAAQPGFLEAGLALAWMQHDGREQEAAATLDRFIKQAHALIPKEFKGAIQWVHLGNRCYHRMLWLRLKLHHDAGELPAAVRVARKMLKLNPNDNLGVRHVLPLLLLTQGEYVAARRATKSFDGEPDSDAAAIRAFCELALDNQVGFRRELAASLFSLPWLRDFLLNQSSPLPGNEDGFRSVQPDLETFVEFAWPAYVGVPSLRATCEAFLAEPLVLSAEAELRHYWKGYWRRDGNRVGTHLGWLELCREWQETVATARVAYGMSKRADRC